MGGATDGGRGAIVLSECFTRGYSSKSDTFANDVLCGANEQADTQGGNFIIDAMEIWGFDIERPVMND